MTQPDGSDGVLATGRLWSVVYPNGGPDLDDAAEAYHESSKLYPSFSLRQAPGVWLLETEPELQRLVRRAVRRHGHRPAIPLGAAELPDLSLGQALAARRSRRGFAPDPLPLPQLGTVLQAAYGVTNDGEQPLRSVPSGGALYPLELYLVVARVGGVEPGLYHYDPLRHVLEELRLAELTSPLAEAMIYPELAECAAFVAMTALFWRTRFKYGLRGYRFALLEAGHVAQNVLLSAAALGLAAVPVGGFYDRRLEDLLGVDGVNESAVYGIAVGAPEGAV